jgi:hypothetical protein
MSQILAEAFKRIQKAAESVKDNPEIEVGVDGKDLLLLISEYFRVESELTQIDILLSRRSALDDFKTRYTKIQYAITMAAQSESRQRHLMDMYKELGVEWGHDIFARIKYLVNLDDDDVEQS